MLGQFSAQEVAKPTFKAPTLRRNGQTFANDMIFTLRQKKSKCLNKRLSGPYVVYKWLSLFKSNLLSRNKKRRSLKLSQGT